MAQKATEPNEFWESGQHLSEKDKEILRPLIEKAKQLGRTPTKSEVESAGLIKGRFRIWKNAVKAAGLPPLNDREQTLLREGSGQKVNTTKLQREVALTDFIQACVDVPRVSGYCASCRNYGAKWSCPPFQTPPMAVWAAYDSLLLYGVKISTPVSDLNQTYDQETLQLKYEDLLSLPRASLHEELLQMEQNLPGSLSLYAGSCVLCGEDTCTRKTGKPCRLPQEMRYSIEALGGDVSLCLERYFNKKLLWAKEGKLPPTFILLGGLLKKAVVVTM